MHGSGELTFLWPMGFTVCCLAAKPWLLPKFGFGCTTHFWSTCLSCLLVVQLFIPLCVYYANNLQITIKNLTVVIAVPLQFHSH